MNGNQLIGNSESAEGDSTFNAINPGTGDTLEPAFHEATQAEIDRDLKQAHQNLGHCSNADLVRALKSVGADEQVMDGAN